MNLPEELERLSKLHASGSLSSEEFAKAKALVLSGRVYANWPVRSVRRQSARKILGLPLWAVALGPDPERGEMRGHARGFFAVGDIATGVFAFGGLAIGFVAFGGAALGLLLAVGGAAIGGVALGGGAIGVVAAGGGAFGYYAAGGGAAGAHTVSGIQQDPAAVEFFRRFLPWMGTQ